MVAKKLINSFEQWNALVDDSQAMIRQAKEHRDWADQLSATDVADIAYHRDLEDRYLQWSMAASLLALNYKP